MNRNKRLTKENTIVEAAELTFASVGFSNATMGEIAQKVGISKGTVYFYFGSKENLYMAVVYKAWQLLLEEHYQCLQHSKDLDGLSTTLALFKSSLTFSETHPFYFDLIMDYVSIIRSTNKLESSHYQGHDAFIDNLYFRKIQDIDNLPLSIVTKEIKRGQEDGSIKNERNPIMIYLSGWALVTGYVTLNTTNTKTKRSTIFKVPIEDWRNYTIKIITDMLLDQVEAPIYENEASLT